MRLWNGRTCLRPYIKNAVTDFPATAFFFAFSIYNLTCVR